LAELQTSGSFSLKKVLSLLGGCDDPAVAHQCRGGMGISLNIERR
jgi:hypothetical protein